MVQERRPTAHGRSPVADARVDNGWGALLDRLEAYAALPVATFPKAARARLLVDLISPDRAWLNLSFAAQWAESNKRIQRIDDEGLAADIDALAGKEFLVEVRSAHAEYGAALGMKDPWPIPMWRTFPSRCARSLSPSRVIRERLSASSMTKTPPRSPAPAAP